MDDYVEISAMVRQLTEKAVRIERDLPGGGMAESEWVPLSQIEEPELLVVGVCDVLSVRTWLAEDRDWPEAG